MFRSKSSASPTVREPDGLAMSSRNQRLSPAERALAPLLYQALQLAASRIAQGVREPHAVKQEALALLAHPEIRVEYLEIVDPDSMQPIDSPIDPSAGVPASPSPPGLDRVSPVLSASSTTSLSVHRLNSLVQRGHFRSRAPNHASPDASSSAAAGRRSMRAAVSARPPRKP